ncbi:MAG: GAF and ANTAR domain-containing protein [Egibacteraceae bacterium]
MSKSATNVPEGLAELSLLLFSEETLDSTLEQVAQLAVKTIPGCDTAGVALVRDDRITGLAASDELAKRIDVAQYETGEGPCLEAVRQRRTFRLDDTATNNAWPAFSVRARADGISSCLAFPLVVDHLVGSLNLYALRVEAFDEAAHDLAAVFAAHAAVTLANAQLVASRCELTEQLQQALTSRAVIDQAKGILMEREGIDAEAAYRTLVTASQHSHVKLHEIARQLVDLVSRRHTRTM